MAEGLSSLIDSIARLRLADGTAELSGSTSSCSSSYQTLVEATWALIQCAEATAAHAQRMSLTESPDPRGGQDIVRLKNAHYDNGEYLSPGELHHMGWSCMLSLGQLIRAGLHNLYSEFAEESAKGQ